MQINTTKTGRKVKLTKREKDAMCNVESVCTDLHMFAIRGISPLADAAATALLALREAIEKHEAPEPAAK